MNRLQTRSVVRLILVAVGLSASLFIGCIRQATNPIPGLKRAAFFGSDYVVGALCWHPKDPLLAFERIRADNGAPTQPHASTVGYCNVDDGKTEHVSNGPADITPVWTPDGTSLVYSHTGDSQEGLRVYDMVSQETHLAVSGFNYISRSGESWLPSGDMVFGARLSNGKYQISRWKRENNEVTPYSISQDNAPIYPVSSPNGELLAFIDKAASPRRLYVISTQKGEVVFSSNPKYGMVYDVSWSGKGNELVYLSDTGKDAQLHMVNIPKQTDEILATASSFTSPLSMRHPDGEIAVGVIDDGKGVRIDLYDTNGRLLAQSPDEIVAAKSAWSPDGHWLAFGASPEDKASFGVYVMEFATLMKEWKQ